MSKYNIYFYICTLVLQNVYNLGEGYRHIRPQDYLCSDKLIIALQKPFRGNPAFTLADDHESAAIITQVWNTTVKGSHGSNKLKYDCQFQVRTPSQKTPRGIYTVITKLKFRQHPTTGSCIDYIQFTGANHLRSDKICNNISSDGPAGQLIFHKYEREISVHIHIDKDYMIVEPLELRMVLTAHSQCKFTGDFLCNPTDPYSCISRHFVRDNITNCNAPCRDEISCFQNGVSAEEVDTTNVAISAITSLIFTMLGVGFCVWICWKYWNCITVQQREHEESAAAHRRATQMQDVPTIDVPTAMLDDVIATTHEPRPPAPKDLPPSYESLFPSR